MIPMSIKTYNSFDEDSVVISHNISSDYVDVII